MVASLTFKTAVLGFAALVSMVSAAPHHRAHAASLEPRRRQAFVDDSAVAAPFAKPGGDAGCVLPNCERCQLDHNGIPSCKKCTADHWQVDGACVSKKGCLVPDCQTCEARSDTVCKFCNPGFTLVSGACLPPAPQCPENCNTCVEGQCTDCNAGFFIRTDGQCQECTPNCVENQFQSQACSATQDRVCTECTPCGEGFFVSQACSAFQDRVCTACNALAGGRCQSCTNEGQCVQCQAGFELVGQECVAVCPAHCSSCNANGQCLTCSEGHYLEAGQCKDCAAKWAHCAKCEWKKVVVTNVLQCTACAEGFKWNAVTQKCETVNCPDGEYPEGSACKPCSEKIEFCSRCNRNSGVVTCDSCTDGYKPALGGLSCAVAECPECDAGQWRFNVAPMCTPLDGCKPWSPECSGFLVIEIAEPTPWNDRVCLDVWNTLLKPVVDKLTGNLMSIWERAMQCLQSSHPYQYCGCIGNMINEFNAEINKLNDQLKALQNLPMTEEIMKQIEMVTQAIDFVTKTAGELENIIGVLQQHRICQ